MSSGDRALSIVSLFICSTIIAVIFMVSGCVQKENKLEEPRQVMIAKSEHIQRMRCIENRGSWTYESYVGGKCQFK